MLLGVRCRRHGAIFRRMRESPEMHGVPLVPAEQGQELTICSNSFNDEVNSGFPAASSSVWHLPHLETCPLGSSHPLNRRSGRLRRGRLARLRHHWTHHKNQAAPLTMNRCHCCCYCCSCCHLMTPTPRPLPDISAKSTSSQHRVCADPCAQKPLDIMFATLNCQQQQQQQQQDLTALQHRAATNPPSPPQTKMMCNGTATPTWTTRACGKVLNRLNSKLVTRICMTAEYPPSATTFIIVLWGEGECRHSDKMTYKKASKSGSSRHGCPGERKGWHGHSKIFSVSTASVLCTPPRKLAALFQGVRGSLARSNIEVATTKTQSTKRTKKRFYSVFTV